MTTVGYKNKILNELLDGYEKSKLFIGTNKVKQVIHRRPSDIEGRYTDSAQYKLFSVFNDAAGELEELGFIFCKRQKNGEIIRIDLNDSRLSEIYDLLHRTPKSETNGRLISLLKKYCGCGPVLESYCSEQLKNIEKNKNVKFFDGDFHIYEDVLKGTDAALKVEKETFERDFSIAIFGDSKRFETVKPKIKSLLVLYGGVPDPETVFEDLNIVKNPGHVCFKGKGSLTVGEQTIDFSQFSRDIAFSSAMLDEISEIKVFSSKVITVENLTTFNSYSDPDAVMIYLGGFHNTARRQFIRKVYDLNPEKRYLHYGDIDAGGFYILLHLKEKTGVPFEAFRMDIETLKKYRAYTKPLTANDFTRLKNLQNGEFRDTISYMLENNCKLEQEACD